MDSSLKRWHGANRVCTTQSLFETLRGQLFGWESRQNVWQNLSFATICLPLQVAVSFRPISHTQLTKITPALCYACRRPRGYREHPPPQYWVKTEQPRYRTKLHKVANEEKICGHVYSGNKQTFATRPTALPRYQMLSTKKNM